MAQLVVTTSWASGRKYLMGYSYPDYNDAHDDAGYALVTKTTHTFLGQFTTGGTHYHIDRLGWIFDTSVLPPTAVIFSAFISFRASRDPIGRDFDITLVSGADIADGGLVVADFGDLLDETISRGNLNTSGVTQYNWYNINLNAIGKSEVSKGGITKFGVRCSLDIDSNPPALGTSDIAYIDCSTGNDVKLTINYATAPGFIWIDGTRFYFVSEVDKKHIEGRYAGVYGATAGYLYVEGLYLVYTDEDGHKRKRKGYKKGATGVDVSNGCPIWVEKTKISYIDANGDERFLPIWWFNTDVFNRPVFNG